VRLESSPPYPLSACRRARKRGRGSEEFASWGTGMECERCPIRRSRLGAERVQPVLDLLAVGGSSVASSASAGTVIGFAPEMDAGLTGNGRWKGPRLQHAPAGRVA